MRRGNVLVIGNSGVGKSTLINAVLGDNKAKTGYGTKGTTEELELYESEEVPFRVIDTVGFVPSRTLRSKAIKSVKDWSEKSAKLGYEDTLINAIWFCVEGTSSKLFPESIDNLVKATSMWKTVPVIVVITKSYSVPERDQNVGMVIDAFGKHKKFDKRVSKIIPVVASTYRLNDEAFAPPEGIAELIDETNKLMPEGIKAGKEDVFAFKLKRNRVLAHGIVGTSTAAAAVIGAVPIPFSDALLLAPIELFEISSIASIYGLKKNEESRKFIDSIVEVGTIGVAAKAAIGALKAIPGINIGASVLNAVVAGSIVAAVGEGSIYAFEQVYLGKKTLSDVEWVRKFMEGKLSIQFIDTVKTIAESITENTEMPEIAKIIAQMFIGDMDKGEKK